MKPIHPLAALFPMLPDDELNDLANDIASNGLNEPIKVWDDQVIDGQNRQEACIRAGVEPDYEEFEGDEDDVKAFIISKNLARRHLNKGQQAMAYALIYPEGDERGRGKKGLTVKSALNAHFSSRRLQQARQVFNFSEELAKDVLAGVVSLNDVLDEMKPPKPKDKVLTNKQYAQQVSGYKPQPKPQTEINPAETAGFSDEVEGDVYVSTPTPQPVKPVPSPAIQTKTNGYEPSKTPCLACDRAKREAADNAAKLATATAQVERLTRAANEMERQVKDIKEDAALLNDIRKFLDGEQWNDLIGDMRESGLVA